MRTKLYEVQGDRVGVSFDLLGKSVGQASEAAHVHPHREILTFGK